jgi:prophage regulatory protein
MQEVTMAIRTILRLPEVVKATGNKKSQIYALMSTGDFPRPVKISSQCVGWFQDEIEEWQETLSRSTGGWCPRDRKRQPSTETA